MATSNLHSFIMLLIFVAVVTPLLFVSGNVIDDTCSSHDYVEPGAGPPNYCRECLNANPRSGTSNKKGLAGILLDCSVDSAAKARDKAFALSAQDSQRMPKCAQAFADAHGSLKRARTLFQAGDMSGAKTAALVCMDSKKKCLNAFYGSGVKVPDAIMAPMEKLDVHCDSATDLL